MKNCAKCGAMLNDDAAACPACERASAMPPEAPAIPFPPEPPPQSKAIGCLMNLLALVVIGIGFMIWNFSRYGFAGRLMRGSGMGYMRGQLGAIRSALSLYYGDTQGHYPSEPSVLAVGGKYLPSVPPTWSGGDAGYDVPHQRNADFAIYPKVESHDTGRWAYDDNPADPNFGTVWIDCTHTDPKGSAWSSY